MCDKLVLRVDSLINKPQYDAVKQNWKRIENVD